MKLRTFVDDLIVGLKSAHPGYLEIVQEDEADTTILDLTFNYHSGVSQRYRLLLWPAPPFGLGMELITFIPVKTNDISQPWEPKKGAKYGTFQTLTDYNDWMYKKGDTHLRVRAYDIERGKNGISRISY